MTYTEGTAKELFHDLAPWEKIDQLAQLPVILNDECEWDRLAEFVENLRRLQRENRERITKANADLEEIRKLKGRVEARGLDAESPYRLESSRVTAQAQHDRAALALTDIDTMMGLVGQYLDNVFDEDDATAERYAIWLNDEGGEADRAFELATDR